MSYRVIKTISGHQYYYLQTSYRVGKKVKTKSVYLGPVRGVDWAATFSMKGPHIDEMALQAAALADDAKYAAMKEHFHKGVGLKIGPNNPTPVAKDVIAPAEAPAPASPSSPDVAAAGPDAQGGPAASGGEAEGP